MSYTQLDPNLGATGGGALVNTPQNNEAANTLGDIDRQTRNFIHDFLSLVFTDDAPPTLKADALGTLSLRGKVTGAAGGIALDIVAGSVGALDLATGCVTVDKLAGSITAAKMAANSVETASIKDANVTTAKIAPLNVTVNEIANTTITGAKMANGAIDTDQLAAGAVTETKIEDGAVTLAKLVTSSEGKVLIADANGLWQAKSISGDVSLSTLGVVSLNSRGVAIVAEQQNNGVKAGDSVASPGTYQFRGNFDIIDDPATLISGGITDTNKIHLATGTYLIEAVVPGYAVGNHVAVIERYSSAGALYTVTGKEPAIGTGVIATVGASAPYNVQTTSVAKGYFTIASNDYIMIKHYTTVNSVTSGLGLPMSFALAKERYTTVTIQRIST